MLFLVRTDLCSQSGPPRRRGRFAPRLLITTLLAFLALGAAPAASAATYSVSTLAQLDAAVAGAQNGDTIQIAAGTYMLDRTLQPHNGVTLTGTGASSTALDGGSKISIILVNSGITVSLSRLTLQNGEGDNINGQTQGCGGGVYNDNGTATLTDCTLTGNTSTIGYGGAAIFNSSGAVTLTRCKLTGNSVQGNNVVGGGAILNAGSLTLANCDLSGNAAIGHAAPGDTTGYADGGAILSAVLSSSQAAPTVTTTACTFTGNYADYGGAINNNATSQATLTGCTFTQNQAVFGAGLDNNSKAPTALTGCTFTGNTATIGGGGVYNESTLSLTGCTFTGNSATSSISEGAGLDNEGGGSAALANCTFSGNSTHENNQQGSGGGGAIANGVGSTATLSGCTLAGNSAGINGGGMLNLAATAALTGCTLAGNSATYGGGFDNRTTGTRGGATATLTGCTLFGNSASFGGGGQNGSTSTLSMTNCVFATNSATNGNGGGLNTGGQVTLTGCTFSGNNASGASDMYSTSGQGGGLYGSGKETLTNCIFWGDRASNLNQGGPEFISGGDTSQGDVISASYCDVGDNLRRDHVTDGGSNFSADPQFVRAPGTNGSGDPGDLHLRSTSPCLNKGSSQAPGYLPTDIQGVTRPTPTTVGAYEGYEIVVTNTNASGSGSLTSAVNSASNQSGAVITFDPSVFGASGQDAPQTIYLNATLVFNATEAAILGPAPGVVLDGGSAFQIFSISSGANITLRGLQIQFGHVSNGFGGGLYNQGAVTLTNCVLAANTAASGGAIFNRGIAILTNCVLLGNSATSGGAFYNASSLTSGAGGQAALTECTLSGNSATNGGGVCNGSNSANYLTLTDDILWNDTATNGPEIYTFSAAVDAAFCDIKGGVTAAVSDDGGNFSADPLFVMPYSQGATNFDLHVRPGSPAVGAGTAGGGVNYQAVDITGTPRANPPTVGAYEGQQASTRTMLASSLNPSVYGQSVTFTAAVFNLSTSSVPTGTVQFTANGNNIGGPVSLDANGTASLSTTTLPTGSATIQAVYSGPAAYTGSRATLIQTVLIANTTMLASSLNPSVYGQSVTFTATVDTHGGPSPQGSVQFAVDGVNAGTPVSLTGTQASFATSALAIGSHTVTAAFTGAGFQSSSASLVQTINRASVTGVSVAWGKQTASLPSGGTLPWLGINTLVVTLNGPAVLAPGDIALTGKAVASYGPVSVSQSGSVYTVTLAKPITVPDRLTLTIGSAGVNAYSASFSVLPGDVSGDGAVNASDVALVKNAIGGAYRQIDDIDGNGIVDTTDYNAVRQRVGAKLP